MWTRGKVLADNNTFASKSLIDIPTVDHLLKQKSCNDWYQTVNNKPKLRTYRTFKYVYNAEEYVRHCYNRKDRSLLAQIRLGILPLNIETGRYINKPVELRTCDTCQNCVEDEKHFILFCPRYTDLRAILFDNARLKCVTFDDYDADEKSFFLFNSLWKALSVYVGEAFSHRQNMLYMN